MKSTLPSLEHKFLLLQQFGEGTAPPAAEGCPPTCQSYLLLFQPASSSPSCKSVVLPKKSNVQQVTGIDQGFMIIVFSQPYSLLCHLHLCKVIQSKACRNSVNSVHLMRWWCKWLCRVQVVKRGWSLYLHLVYVTFFVVLTVPHPSANAAGWPLVHSKGKSQSDTGITLAGQTSEPCLCGQGRTVRHTGEFSTGNQDKQQIGGIKCQRGHCLQKRLVIKKDETVKEF